MPGLTFDHAISKATVMPPSAKLLAALMAMSLLAWGIVAWVHVVPWLDTHSRREGLLVAVTPHLFRHVGAMAVFPGVGQTPPAWSVPLAWGDGITALLAALSMIALYKSWRHATLVVWAFNLFGLMNLLHNGYNAVVLQIAPQLGVVGYVVAFGVPGMFVAHLLVFRILLKPDAERPRQLTRAHGAVVEGAG